MNQKHVLYLNANILTMDRDLPRAEAMLIGGDRIAAVGSLPDVQNAAPRGALPLNLDGKTVMPGFNDCHCHVLSFGRTLDQLDVSTEAVRSIEDIKRAVGLRAQQVPEGDWIVGRGYNQNVLEEARHPTRTDLDEAAQGHPVVLWHTSGHAVTCNSRALTLAGVTSSTPTPPGGEIERDASGQPTGVLKETPASDLVTCHIPHPTVTEGAHAILRAMEVMASQGITSASDAGTGSGQGIDSELKMYSKAVESGELAGRLTLMPQIRYAAPPGSEEIHRVDELDTAGDELWLHIGATKIFSDGALTTRTAALREPYADGDGNRGLLLWDRDVMGDMIRRVHRAGWQIATHAIGDRAIETVLDCYQEALEDTPREDHRHRIEHCMLLDRDLARRMRRLGVVPTIQPGFIARLGDAYIEALGMERAAQLMPMQLFEEQDTRVGFSSDRPVIPGAPLSGIRSAVERLTPKGVALGVEHKIGVLDAIRHYTSGAAYATHAEQEKGSLRPGALADFVVLSDDPTSMPVSEFDRVMVIKTVAGGIERFTK